MTNLIRRAYISTKSAMLRFKEEDHGDTTFIAIIIAIGLVLALAVVFRKSIGDLFSSLWNKFVVGGSTGQVDTGAVGTMDNPFPN